jgi:hypothetical protein
MLVIDELSGLPHEAISRMSGVRSSGIAEIIKIQTERTASRVRGLWMSNPRGKRPLAAFNSGIAAIEDLIGHPEDIARFDAALTVATAEVPLSIINTMDRPEVPHTYTTHLCNRLAFWAWSRKAHQVEFAAGAEQACLTHATELSRKYVPPLVEGAEQRIKLARLSVAAAARVFSTNAGGDKVHVTPMHVEFVAEFLNEIYSKPSMAFDLHSQTKLKDGSLEQEEEVRQRVRELPADFRYLVADAPAFQVGDVSDWCTSDRETAAGLVSFLVRHRAIRKGRFGYYKTPAFIQFLRHFDSAGRGPIPIRREPGDDGLASDGVPF